MKGIYTIRRRITSYTLCRAVWMTENIKFAWCTERVWYRNHKSSDHDLGTITSLCSPNTLCVRAERIDRCLRPSGPNQTEKICRSERRVTSTSKCAPYLRGAVAITPEKCLLRFGCINYLYCEAQLSALRRNTTHTLVTSTVRIKIIKSPITYNRDNQAHI